MHGTNIIKQFNRANGVIDIVWLDTNNKVINNPETPILLGTGMKAVKWDGVPGNYQEKASDNYATGWYDYNNQKWANAKATSGIDEAYFVWIPRYAYKIVYFDTPENANAYRNNNASKAGIIGYSNKFGMVDAVQNKIVNDTEPTNIVGAVKTAKYSDYIVHPAFEFDGAKKGIWIGKYESSGTISAIEIKPLVKSLINQNISRLFDAGLNIKTMYNLSGNSHMAKNIEWGACAYLTESKYGRNGEEVTINNHYVGNTIKTGYAGASVSAGRQTEMEDLFEYNTEKGVLASTTGNIYGIYDMSGGSWDYVAGNLLDNTEGNISGSIGSAASEGKFNEIFNGTNKELKTKYFDFYNYSGETSVTLARESNFRKNLDKKGDALIEISLSVQGVTGWHSDYAYFVETSVPFFVRGGNYYHGSGAGVFSFSNFSGISSSGYALRIAITP